MTPTIGQIIQTLPSPFFKKTQILAYQKCINSFGIEENPPASPYVEYSEIIP